MNLLSTPTLYWLARLICESVLSFGTAFLLASRIIRSKLDSWVARPPRVPYSAILGWASHFQIQAGVLSSSLVAAQERIIIAEKSGTAIAIKSRSAFFPILSMPKADPFVYSEALQFNCAISFRDSSDSVWSANESQLHAKARVWLQQHKFWVLGLLWRSSMRPPRGISGE